MCKMIPHNNTSKLILNRIKRCYPYLQVYIYKGVGRKISQGREGGGQRKKDRKVALLSLFQGGGAL